MKKVILFNPRSANTNHRIPNSVLQVAASIHGKFEYVFVDGNREPDALQKIESHLATGEFFCLGTTVMPGPQLKMAISICKSIRDKFPEVIQVWGGYFPSNQYQVTINAPFVDFIVDGPGDLAFPKLLEAASTGKEFGDIPNLIFLDKGGRIKRTGRQNLLDQDLLPPLPYTTLDAFYALRGYLPKTHLGNRTIAYHSSMGCPFKCSFCAVVPIYQARWKGKSAEKIYNDIKFLKDKYGGDSIEFHDNNFFVSEKRTVEFAHMIAPEKMNWWGEGRIDTLDQYKETSLEKMRSSGCRMIFFGAESSNDDILQHIDKGGTQTARQILDFAGKMKKHDIIPEYSFVLGFPGSSEREVKNQIERDIDFIRKVKEVNPATEIIIYVYSPVPTVGSDLFDSITDLGFQFPKRLEDWQEPQWENFDLRKNPLTPWLTTSLINRIKDFETVLNAYHPTVSDLKLKIWHRWILRLSSFIRYRFAIYKYPYELKFLLYKWLRYRQPEIEGF